MTALTSKCPCCGSSDFTLAEDRTEYFDVQFVDGEPRVVGHRHVEPGERRLFCVDCHAPFDVPDELDASEV